MGERGERERERREGRESSLEGVEKEVIGERGEVGGTMPVNWRGRKIIKTASWFVAQFKRPDIKGMVK